MASWRSTSSTICLATTLGRPSSVPTDGWRPGGWLMVTLPAADDEDAVDPDWLGVPMFFSGCAPETNERLLREAGFQLELSEVHHEREAGHGPVRFQWVIARKPD